MADNRTNSQREAEGYPWIGCECCKDTVWVPFKMRCDKYGKRPERYYPANQSGTPGFVRSF